MPTMTIEQALQLAVAHHNAGRLGEAEALYRQILSTSPNHADALHRLGMLAEQVGQRQAGIELIRGATAVVPHEPRYHFSLGNSLSNMGQFDEAIACYRRALELRPDHAETHNNLGNALQGTGRLEEALVCFRRAVELKPDCAAAHYNFGNAWNAAGKFDEAIACYRQALKLRTDIAEAHYNLANAWNAKGRPDEAIACFRRALECKPNYAQAHNNLGNVCSAMGQLDEAVACFRRALEIRPDLAEAHNNLGMACEQKGQPDEAIACYRRALELKPNYAEAHNNLGNACKDKGQLDEAIACYERAVAINPDGLSAHDNLLFALQFHPQPRNLLEAARRWDQRHGRPLQQPISFHGNDRSPDRRLRIGYVSAHFCDHCQSFFTVPLLSCHDHERFEIFCYADVRHAGVITARLRSHADVWRDIAFQSDEAVAARIREDRIDILVDLALHMEGNRLLIFARKPAPVQVTWLGYPGTTGMSTMDYRLTDPHLDPPGLNDACYSEESILLPDTFWCYDPLCQEPSPGDLPASRDGRITFGCLNNFCKVNDAVLQLWSKVLGAVEGSRLILLAAEGSHRHRCLEKLGSQGIGPERIEFVPRHPRRQYLELYHRIDIGLDTFPYNGHTTSLDSFWMGVPVITLVGQTVVGRAGLCQLMNLGLEGLIARTPEQFVQIAADLANDLPRLKELRSTLRQRMECSPLMDGKRFARGVEAAYRTMWMLRR